jgi:N-acetylmuramic acid 6-phosphate etherase
VVEIALTSPLPEAIRASVAVTDHSTNESGELPSEQAATTATPPLDRLSALEIARRMNREDSGVPMAVERELGQVAAAMETVAHAFSKGGRLIYVGAGTSGRLGVMDASECPPTFGVAPGLVTAIVAGGDAALRHSVEGAEDNRDQAATDLRSVKPALSARDIVAGISASGTTPYVLGALDEARARGATTILVCCNPSCRDAADLVVAMDVGGEVLAGSTRLKAGTATKLVLNMISTGSMALAGYMYEGLMVGVQPVNDKLRRRAAGIVSALAGLTETDARARLEEAGWRVDLAVLMARTGLGPDEATRRLATTGNLRAALETAN